MISVSSAYNNIITGGGSYEWRITNGANTWTIANLIGGTLTTSMFDELSVGNAPSAQLDLTLWDVTPDTSSPLVLQFRATDGASTQSAWHTKGTFFIDTVETSPYSEETKIVAFDSMLKAEIPFMVSGTWTAITDAVVLNRIAQGMGVGIESATSTLIGNNPITLTTSPNVGINGTTEREMLCAIAAMRGGNFVINNQNQLKLIRPYVSPSNTANIGDAVDDIDASPAETVKRVKVTEETSVEYLAPPLPILTHLLEAITTHTPEDILAYATGYEQEWNEIGGRILNANIPVYGTQAVAESLYSLYSDKTFYPFSAQRAFVDPKYEVGDGIIIKDTTSIIASQELDIDPLSSSTVEFGKDSTLQSFYPYRSAFRRGVQYQVTENKINISANASAIAENTAAIANQSSQIAAIPAAIKAQTDLITGGYGGYLKFVPLPDGTPSEMLIMDASDIANATNVLRFNRSGIGFSTDGGNTYATAWTIDGSFNANYITTGTLNADRIAANSISIGKLTGSITNGNWVLDLDNGTLTIGDISADNIVAGTITDASGLNSWNLTTGEFITQKGEIGGWEIDTQGLSYTPQTTSGNAAAFMPTGLSFTQGAAYEPRARSVVEADNISLQFRDGLTWNDAVSLQAVDVSGTTYGMLVGPGGNSIYLADSEVGFYKNVYMNGTLGVLGAATFTGNATINGLLSVDKYIYQKIVLSAGSSTTVNFGSVAGYRSAIIVGTVGGTGGVVLGVTVNATTITARNLMTNAAWTGAGLQFSISTSGGDITLRNSSSAGTQITIYAG